MAAVVARGAIMAALGVSGDTAGKLLSSPSFQFSQPEAGAKWFSWTDGHANGWNGQVVSAYYHPTKKHSATTKGKLGVKRSVANGGKWAVSKQTKGLFGNKAYYNNL
jgi:hypothetical protein